MQSLLFTTHQSSVSKASLERRALILLLLERELSEAAVVSEFVRDLEMQVSGSRQTARVTKRKILVSILHARGAVSTSVVFATNRDTIVRTARLSPIVSMR